MSGVVIPESGQHDFAENNKKGQKRIRQFEETIDRTIEDNNRNG